MKNTIKIYIALVITLSIQLLASRYSKIFPDLSLMLVVFGGIFFGFLEGVALGIVTGFLRGCFSSGAMAPQVISLGVVAYMSSMFSSMFYRKNPFFHALSILVACLLVVFVQIVHLRTSYSSDISFLEFTVANKWRVFYTVLTGPLIFQFWFFLFRTEESYEEA